MVKSLVILPSNIKAGELQLNCLPIFKHFLARKFMCFAHRLFTSKKPMSYDP